MTREVVDLILRAAERGRGHGLPMSFLNRGGHERQGVFGANEAHIVDGQLLLASRAEVEVDTGQEATTLKDLFTYNVCAHLRCTKEITGRISQALEQAIPSMIAGSERSENFNCPWCETDHRVQVYKSERHRTRIVVNVWRNYGRRNDNTLLTEQIFHLVSTCKVRLDADTVAQRNIRAAFESGGRRSKSSKLVLGLNFLSRKGFCTD